MFRSIIRTFGIPSLAVLLASCMLLTHDPGERVGVTTTTSAELDASAGVDARPARTPHNDLSAGERNDFTLGR